MASPVYLDLVSLSSFENDNCHTDFFSVDVFKSGNNTCE